MGIWLDAEKSVKGIGQNARDWALLGIQLARKDARCVPFTLTGKACIVLAAGSSSGQDQETQNSDRNSDKC